MQPLTPEEIDRLARKRAGAKLGWYIHAAFYVAVNLLLLAVSDVGFGTRRWTPFPMVGWGIGLLLHGVSVFLIGGNSGLRERMVEREREKLRRQHGSPRP
ncbi:2TM domain-containing protein [Ramlibacter sp. MMS24-I3-19]|uniref:2TM domain-containing protein n=1 Tax=Ramlibacter sp. MMS24-I3-19 TaxID=3416606 RepID=UPI003D08477E